MNNGIKELTDFLDRYNVKYEIVEDRVVADTVTLNHNKLTSLPESIGNLKCGDLYLDHNKLTSLPESIGDLNCEVLWLDHNNLTSLPESFGNLKCKRLWLDLNNLTSESKKLLEELKSIAFVQY